MPDGRRHGSSPRVRGTPSAERARDLLGRFIPACAGNAMSRIGGVTVTDGSSPRVRGTPSRDGVGWLSRRFIPACAGNASAITGPAGARAVHPACAGNARSCGSVLWQRPVHPRVCGERDNAIINGNDYGGSSPRVRGTRSVSVLGIMRPRFIPACAGNAARLRLLPRDAPVHPRVCGERIRVGQWRRFRVGSSPRVRGTRRNHGVGCAIDRFIPACAGNARQPSASRSQTAVHPRVCGERRLPRDVHSQDDGSSPRVRGTPQRPLAVCCPLRFIPACAGNASELPNP